MRLAILVFIGIIAIVGCATQKETQTAYSSKYTSETTDEDEQKDSVGSVETESPKQIIHIVKSGESLSLIAKQYGVSLEKLVNLNKIDNPDLIVVGQKIVIPESEDSL
ncbi:LysM peptidoglycan-binding domain-containing protein [Labilibacter sediminis]|nr:LysM peptidoglycan-binding domain-containing protein [Labilibacter sediminis]